MKGLCDNGWFMEESEQWPGQAMSLKVDKVKYSNRSQLQELAVFENKGPWGTVMTLDGCIQLTDKDEFVYHEMMAHVPLSLHPNPKHVLIIGGGDGGVMREVLKHSTVERCDLVDIDGDVIEQSKLHFPQVAVSFSNPKSNAVVGDGAAFVSGKENEYDVIVVDSSDPDGPASVLFGVEFYSNVKKALKPGGIVCSQGECIWIHALLIEKMVRFLSDDVGFSSVHYGMMYIPTYPCGSIGCLVSCKETTAIAVPTRPLESCPFFAELKYYDSNVHRAAFVLPKFASHLNHLKNR